MNGRRGTVSSPERYVTAVELGTLMGVSVSTIKRFVRAGMPSEDWGMRRTRRFLPSEAMKWAAGRSRVKPSRDRAHNATGNRESRE